MASLGSSSLVPEWTAAKGNDDFHIFFASFAPFCGKVVLVFLRSLCYLLLGKFGFASFATFCGESVRFASFCGKVVPVFLRSLCYLLLGKFGFASFATFCGKVVPVFLRSLLLSSVGQVRPCFLCFLLWKGGPRLPSLPLHLLFGEFGFASFATFCGGFLRSLCGPFASRRVSSALLPLLPSVDLSLPVQSSREPGSSLGSPAPPRCIRPCASRPRLPPRPDV
jgi:hypothetical protein